MVLLIGRVIENISMSKSTKDDKFLKKLGARLRAIRNDKGWTLEETEEHGWPNWRHLQKIESGKNVTVSTIKKLSDLYKIPVSEILADL